MILLLTFTVNRGIIVTVNNSSPNGAEKENTMKYNHTITKAAEIISVALVGAGIAADGWTMQIISAAPVGADADRYTVAVYQPRHRIPSTVWALTIDTAHDGWTIAARTMECIYNRDTMGTECAPRHALTSAMTGRIRITAAEADTETTETAPAAEPETEAETETAERAESPEIIARMTESITTAPAHSAWARGVKAYAAELCSSLRGAAAYAAETGTPSPLTDRETVRAVLLNGARDWREYSYGGCALIYAGDIAARLCAPSELRRTHGGQRDPNPRETWLDVQARALYQAGAVVLAAYDKTAREGARV